MITLQAASVIEGSDKDEDEEGSDKDEDKEGSDKDEVMSQYQHLKKEWEDIRHVCLGPWLSRLTQKLNLF